MLAESETVLAELVEAAIGACFLAFGFERVAAAVVAAFAGRVEYVLEEHVDHKTVLQEELARQGWSVTYLLVDAIGPDHDRLLHHSGGRRRARAGPGLGLQQEGIRAGSGAGGAEGALPDREVISGQNKQGAVRCI